MPEERKVQRSSGLLVIEFVFYIIIYGKEGYYYEKDKVMEKAVSGTLAAGLVVSMTACGGGKATETVEPGTPAVTLRRRSLPSWVA